MIEVDTINAAWNLYGRLSFSVDSGRCNRNGGRERPSTVEVVDLVDEKGKRYADMIYDDIHLQVTRQLTREDIEEKDILLLATQYFEVLSSKKNTGLEYLEEFAGWEAEIRVRELLRGKEREKYTFVVLKQDSGLRKEMARISAIEDRWKRREAWRAIAGRIARISISVYAKPGFNPGSCAEEYAGLWLLHDDFYSEERGLVLPDDSDDEALVW